MAATDCVLAIDQGTTSSRTIVFGLSGQVLFTAQREFKQSYPQPGWVEHDALEILDTQKRTLDEAILWVKQNGLQPLGIGVTNQRETITVWDAVSGQPVAPAIVWQDRRTTEACERLAAGPDASYITSQTGLRLDPYFSATKLMWMLQNEPSHVSRANRGELLCGTMDSWIIWNLSGGTHVTDPSNASRTMLFSIESKSWDDRLLSIFGVPRNMLPRIVDSSGQIAVVASGEARGIPILSCIGDQQAALYGQGCLRPGMAKNTYGTGCFMLQNIGSTPRVSGNGLLTTVAWSIGGEYTYAMEGSVFVAGALVQWLRDGLQIIARSREIEALAASVPDSGGVVIVPAFAGLGAPDWDPRARGLIIGITRGTTRAHIARATEEAIAFQVADLVSAMAADSKCSIAELRVDGGGANDALLMQLQADIAGVTVVKPQVSEATALGAANLALKAIGREFELAETNTRFSPRSAPWVKDQRSRWRDAVARSRGWA